MPSKPRHGRDYRKRTAQNRDLIQVPSAATAYVSVIQVNVTDSQELTWDFDCPLSDLVNGANLGMIPDFTGAVTTTALLGMISLPTAVVDHSSELPPGQCRIVATYSDGTDPSITLFAFGPQNGDDTRFLARPVGALQLGPTFAP